MRKSRPLTFYYKKVKLEDDNTLQNILESIKDLTPEQRKQVEGKKTYILNNVSDYKGIYYAEIVCYETDKVQNIIHELGKNNNLFERSITTKDVATEDEELKDTVSEFVNSRIIFSVSENNLAIYPSVLGMERFVNYLNFLLSTYYWKDPKNVKAILVSDVYTKDLREKLQTTHVQQVKIGQGVLTEISNNSKKSAYELKDKSLLAKISNVVGKQFGFKTAMDESNLRINVTIDYRSTTTDEGHRVLDELTTALATMDESYIEIDFEDGSDYKRGNIRVKGVINQHLLENNNFDRNKLMQDIYAFLEQNVD